MQYIAYVATGVEGLSLIWYWYCRCNSSDQLEMEHRDKLHPKRLSFTSHTVHEPRSNSSTYHVLVVLIYIHSLPGSHSGARDQPHMGPKGSA